MAELEDPGIPECFNEEEEVSVWVICPSGPRLKVFTCLKELEIWIPRTYMDADSEEEDDSEVVEGGDGVTNRQCSPGSQANDLEESMKNFTNTMRDKNPRVKVTYREFPDAGTMKKCWLEH